MNELIFLSIGLIAGFLIGWFFGKNKAYQSVDLSQQSSMLSSLTLQIAEMKVKFEEIEKSRSNLEKERAKYDEEREKRLKEWVENTHKLFNENVESNKKVDEEKEKRLKEWMEQTNKFFEEQKGAYDKFLTEQGKSREEIEKKRDAQLQDMNRMISIFTRTVAGTKQRGMVAEEQLKEVLTNSIKAGVVKCDLVTDNGQVEFAWNLEDGKFIPIDCKMPDVMELLDQYNSSTEIDQQRQLKKQIIGKLKRQITQVQKYQNLSNTIDCCILVVPEGIMEIAPELVGFGKEECVFICSYKDVFPIAFILNERYIRLKEEGDIGSYKQIILVLFQILDKIAKKTDAIEKALVTIANANNAIKTEIMKGKRQSAITDVAVESED